jgi:hypothetical protein
MKPPVCKLCKKAHWTYEEHAAIEPSVPGYVKEMAVGAMGVHQGPPTQLGGLPIKRTEPISVRNNRTDEPIKRTRGRPKKWSSEAERLRAYRERSRG